MEKKKKIILFDFDSTLVDCETIDEIAKEAGVEEEVKKITKEAMEGKLNFEQSLRRRVSLLKGLPVEKVKRAVSKIKLMTGAEETVKELKKKGYVVGVVSGGFDIAVERIKEKLELDYAYANKLIENGGILSGC